MDETSDDTDGNGEVIEHHTLDAPAYQFNRYVDTRFGDWRSEYMERRWG